MLVCLGSLIEPMGSKGLISSVPSASVQFYVFASHLLCLLPDSCWFLAWLTHQPRKTEATCSSGTSADCQWITQCHVPEDRTLHNQHCENFTSDMNFCVVFRSCSGFKELVIQVLRSGLFAMNLMSSPG
jgi:hypothetical protein